MEKAIKREFILHKQDTGWLLASVAGAYILGLLIFKGMILFSSDEVKQYVELGSLLGAIIWAFMCGAIGTLQMSLGFNLAVSMGVTRKHFFWANFAAILTEFLFCGAFLILLGMMERFLLVNWYPALSIKTDMVSFFIRWWLPGGVCMAAFSSLQGICYLRVGRIFLWIEYGLVLLFNFMITPALRNRPQNAHSIVGMIGSKMKEFFFTMPYVHKLGIILLLTIAFLVPAYLLTKKQKVTW